MYQNDPLKVLTGEVRLSYVNLVAPRAAQQGAEPKYGVTLLIPKTDVATKAAMRYWINKRKVTLWRVKLTALLLSIPN